MSSQYIAGYGEGAFYPPYLEKNSPAVLTAGWTTIMLGLFHIDSDGCIYFNDTIIFQDGTYVGDSDWISQLDALHHPSSGNGIELIASFGGGGVGDFTNLAAIYAANQNSFAGTNVEKNFTCLASTMNGVVTAVDMDVEDDYDSPSFVALCELVAGLGLKITFCPYTNQQWWTAALQQVEGASPGSVVRWNLQCYSGGTGNDPSQWATAITDQIPGFDTNGYILASASADLSPQEVTQALTSYQDEATVGGAFIWTIDEIMNRGTSGQSMADYVEAIQTALNEDG